MRYNHFDMLPEKAFQRSPSGSIMPQGGGSGSGTPTQTTVNQTSIPTYAQPYVENTLGQAAALTNINQNPYQPYQGQQVAGFSPLQTQAMQNIANQGVAPQLAEASNMASTVGEGGIGAYNTAGGLQQNALGYGAQGANLGIMGGGLYGAAAAGAGANYAGQATNPYAVGAYMSPYMQNVVDVQKQEANRGYDITGAKTMGQGVAAGAFGGTRDALMRAENERNRNIALNQIQAQGSQSAYDKAMQSMQYGSTLGLQGLQTGLQGVNTQLAGTSQGLQGVQGAVGAGQYGLAGLGATNQAAATLGSLGQTQFGQEQAINQAQLQAGAMQQALQQKGLDTAYGQYQQQLQYPYQQLSYMQGIYQGLPLAQQAQSMYQNPSAISQAAGLGTAAYGAYKMFNSEGGAIKPKNMADGGITQLFDVGGQVKSDLYKMEPEELQAYIQESSSPIAKKMAMQILAEKKALAQQNPNAGVAALPSNLPVGGMAGGGIIAFADEGEVKDPNAKPEAPKPIAPGGITPAISPESQAAFSEYAQMIKDQRAGGASEREQAKNMAIMQAGLGMMGGTSPNAFANIAQGIQPAVAQYQQQLQAIKKDDRDSLKQLMELGVSKEKFLQEAQKMGIDVYKADRVFEAHKLSTEGHIKAAQIAAAAKGEKGPTAAGIDQAAINAGAAIIKKKNPSLTMEEAQHQAYTEILKIKHPDPSNLAGVGSLAAAESNAVIHNPAVIAAANKLKMANLQKNPDNIKAAQEALDAAMATAKTQFAETVDAVQGRSNRANPAAAPTGTPTDGASTGNAAPPAKVDASKFPPGAIPNADGTFNFPGNAKVPKGTYKMNADGSITPVK